MKAKRLPKTCGVLSTGIAMRAMGVSCEDATTLRRCIYWVLA
jgi:hypothetical protein